MAAAAGLLVAVLWLTHSDRRPEWTNSVSPSASLRQLGPGDELCVPGVHVPAGADRVRLFLGSSGPPVTARLASAEAQVAGAPHGVDFGVAPRPADRTVTACLTGPGVVVAGSTGGDERGQTNASLNGRPEGSRVAVQVIGPPRSLLASLGDAARRGAVFKAGFVEPWLFALLAALALGACAAGLFALLRAPRALWVVALAVFASGAVWAVVTPAFQGPDENVHYAYAEYLGETGGLPDRDTSARPIYSSAEAFALAGVRNNSMVNPPISRPPWRHADERAADSAARAAKVTFDSGGGATGATIHGPVYYAPAALAAKVAGGSVYDRLFAMRLMSVLMAAFTALLAALAIRELAPGLPWAAPAAGLLVGFGPMFGFEAGTVNADVGVNLAGAALIYLCVRSLRRGLTPWLAVGILAAFALGVGAKETFFALAPVAAFPLLWPLRSRPLLLGGLVAAAVVAGVAVLAAGVVPVPEQSPFSGNVGLRQTAEWLWQLVLPPLPFMRDLYDGHGVVPAWPIYVERTWGAFGWLTVVFPQWVYWLCAAVTAAVAALAVRAAGWTERPAVRERLPAVALLALSLVCVIAAAHLSFIPGGRVGSALEQGRYFFPAITAAAAVAIAACLGLGRRLAPTGATALVSFVMLLSLAGQFLVFTSYYT